MDERTRSTRRDVSKRKALRKRRLAREIYRWSERDYYDNLHQFEDNKIHCSCPMCSAKTRNKGRRKRNNCQRALNYKISDLKKLISMDDDQIENIGFLGHQGSKRRNDW